MLQIVFQGKVGRFDSIGYQDGDLTIETVRSERAPADAEFFVSKVSDKTGSILWRFDKRVYSQGDFFLREVDIEANKTEPLMIYANRRELLDVIPIRDLPKMRIVKDTDGRNSYEGGRSAQAIVELKLLLAEDMNLRPVFRQAERVIAELLRRRQAEARANAKAAQAEANAEANAAKEDRRQEQAARRAALLARPIIYGYTADGQRLQGIPIVGDEYQMLPHQTWVIVVKSYDSEKQVSGPVSEHFMVSKSASGRIEKRHVRSVSAEDPKQPKVVAIKFGEHVFEIGNVYHTISLYERAGIDALHAVGLNGAAKVGLFPANSDGTVTIFEVVKSGPREIGRYKPLV